MSSDLLPDPTAPPARGTAQDTGNANGASGGPRQPPLFQGFRRASELMQQQQPPPAAVAAAAAAPSAAAAAAATARNHGTTGTPRLDLYIPSIPTVTTYVLKDIPNLQIVRDKNGKLKKEKKECVLDPIKDLLKSQRHPATITFITTLTLVMIDSSFTVMKQKNRLDTFLEQEQKEDPENPTFVPRSMRIKTKLMFPPECDDDTIMAKLQEEQTAVNKEFMKKSGALCKQVAVRALEIFRKRHLELFVKHSINLLEIRLKIHSGIFPTTDGPRDVQDLAKKTLIGLIRAPPQEGLKDSFFNEYLEMMRENLIKLVLEHGGRFTTEDAMDSYLATPLTQDELKIIISTLNDVLHYFTVITMELQDYLNLKLRIRKAEEDATTHAARINYREKTSETEVDLEKEPNSTPKDVSSFIRQTANKEVAKAIHRQNPKKSTGGSTAQKRAPQDGKGKSTKTGKSRKEKQQKKKLKGILKKPVVKFQGGANKGGKRNNKKKQQKK